MEDRVEQSLNRWQKYGKNTKRTLKEIVGYQDLTIIPNYVEWGRPVDQRVECADGTSLSVQASARHYCLPKNDVGPYTMVEVGFPRDKHGDPAKVPQSWGTGNARPAVEDWPAVRATVWTFLPVDQVLQYVEEHGGEVTTIEELAEGTA